MTRNAPQIFAKKFSVGGLKKSKDSPSSTGLYRGVVVPEWLVMTDSFADEHGNVVPASHYGMSGDWPLELLVTVTFEEHEGKTRLTLRHVGIPTGENSDLAEAGWNESFDKLAEYWEKV